MPAPVLGWDEDGMSPHNNKLRILTDLLLARYHTGTGRYRCQRRLLAVQRVHLLQRCSGAPALPVAREDVSSSMHVFGHEHGAGRSLPGRVGLAFVNYGVFGAPNEGAIIALNGGEVMETGTMKVFFDIRSLLLKI
jgi:hypothetical protein